MLDKIDLERVFEAARRRGFLNSEIYCEASYHASVQIQGKIEDVRLTHSGGAALRCFTGKTTYHFSTPQASTEALLRLLDNDSGATTATTLPPVESPIFEKMGDGFSKLSQIARSTWAEGEGIRFPRLNYEESFKGFEVADSRGLTNRGREEVAQITAHWTIEKGGTPKRFHAERARGSIDGLIEEVSAGIFKESVRRSLASLNPWPAPQGEIPVLWSARALAKLSLHFLRAFEGDLVLGNHSFLTEIKFPFTVPFSLEDLPDSGKVPCDNEGSPTRNLIVFEEGRPKALACNNSVAEQLAVPSTGHCRRESFLSPPTIGFWNPRLKPLRTLENPISQMQWGLSVRDLEVLRYNPSTGGIRLHLHDLALVHHGAEGEAVEPVEIGINLLTLMQSLAVFSESTETSGIYTTKNGQRFLTEVATPSAISESLLIPGRVPLQNYW